MLLTYFIHLLFIERISNFNSKLRFLEFAYDFRVMLNYNNLMYGLAEFVVETLDGRKWKDIVREEIYQVGFYDLSNYGILCFDSKLNIFNNAALYKR